jgi:AraC-like DNA-binding protein
MIHDWFHFVDVPSGLFDTLDIPTDTLLFPKHWSFITDMVEEIENEFYAQREHHEYLIDSKIKELFVRLSRALKSKYSESFDQKFTSELRQLRGTIAQNLSHDWTVAEMASMLMLSPSRFAHLYHAFYGTTPIDDLIRMRISAAQNALSFTPLSICEIADSLGYRNVTHFCRQFHKMVGVSPSQYRKG